MTSLPIPSEFYDFSPSIEHRSGDIWRDIPMLCGHYGPGTVSGIVVSPACDLERRKTDTITLLPIVPVTYFVTSALSLPEMIAATNGQLMQLGVVTIPSDLAMRNRRPALEHVESCTRVLEDVRKVKTGRAEQTAIGRASAGLRLLTAIISGTVVADAMELVCVLLTEKEVTLQIDRLLRNVTPTTHFFPADGQPYQLNAIGQPSLGLLRHPYSIPINLLDLASEVREADWAAAMAVESRHTSLAQLFSAKRPLKAAKLKPDYHADFVGRFAGLFARVGAPDFDDAFLLTQRNHIVPVP